MSNTLRAGIPLDEALRKVIASGDYFRPLIGRAKAHSRKTSKPHPRKNNMSTNTLEPISARDAIRQIIGEDCADGIFGDCGDAWAIFVAVSFIKARGGPTTDIERRFMAWLDSKKLQ